MRTNICKDCENEFELKPEEKKATALLCPDCKAQLADRFYTTVEVPVETLRDMDAATTAAKALVDEDAVVYMKGDTWCVGVPAAKYPKKRQTSWKKWIDNDVVRWGSGTTAKQALKTACYPRAIKARAKAAEMISAAAGKPAVVEQPEDEATETSYSQSC